jgi:L,D-transpeptidase ErfK/SrfK
MLVLTSLLALILSVFPQAETHFPILPSVVGEVRTYTVAPGDGLYVIARSYGLAYPAVARANGIKDPNVVWAGRLLILPTRLILPVCRGEGVIVNIPEFRMFLFRGRTLRAIYPIAVGLPTWRTPIGSFKISNKVRNPAWYMPPELARREKVKREIIEPGPDNPLGDFWIGTSIRHTGIHSTNIPMTVGRALSHGCVRLYPEHVEELFGQVAVGDSGEFIYQPVKVAVDGDDVLIEVHPDLYGLVPDLLRVAEERLRAFGAWERADPALLFQAVAEARGIPVSIAMK